MENDIQIFVNPEFGKIRITIIDGEPWLVSKDVATALGYKNPEREVRDRIESGDKRVTKMVTPHGKQNTTLINESGFYSLVLSSKLDSAKKFKHWVTSEVLPSIRKTGAYFGRAESGDEEVTSGDDLSPAKFSPQETFDGLLKCAAATDNPKLRDSIVRKAVKFILS